MQISSEQMQDVLFKLFTKNKFPEEKARSLAKVYTESTLDGVNSHGINRVPLFIKYVENGVVKVDAEAEKVETFGSIERWDGGLGPGIINAMKCTNRAIELAKLHGLGMVALRNTNHWMRGGSYGWHAAEAGCISILFTNTQANMPPWGGKDSRLGNNPLVVSIPREQGHIVLDMAMSQFAFGKINEYKLKGEKLPYHGGWDDNNELSNDPEKILREKLINEIIDYAHDVEPMHPGDKTYYPGERTLQTREKNLKMGIPVSEEVWQQVLELLG
jgi:3-dehydro-L-gulonate 2-dehydrogenase